VIKGLLAGDPTGVLAELDQLLARSDFSNDLRSFVVALQAIIGGSRDRSLADAPELHPVSAAELLYVLEALESTR
jgi:hypothetical protein